MSKTRIFIIPDMETDGFYPTSVINVQNIPRTPHKDEIFWKPEASIHKPTSAARKVIKGSYSSGKDSHCITEI